ncbi:MAG: adenylate kinase [Clostridia bacterium]|nr:adenylate kinase [Clostridia bacterium]
MNIILLGAPGAGKGSQATKLKEYYGIPHISTGDAFRSNIARKTEIGVYAKSFIDKGQLGPDDVTVKIVADRLKEDDCQNGFLLDGFPRSIPQAEALEGLTKIDYVINFVIDTEKVVARLGGRRTCSCGETYHVSTHSSPLCDKCGKELFIRDDDKDEVIRNRMAVYEKTTAPLVDFYKERGLVVDVDANGTIEETFNAIIKLVK